MKHYVHVYVVCTFPFAPLPIRSFGYTYALRCQAIAIILVPFFLDDDDALLIVLFSNIWKKNFAKKFSR